MKEITSLYIHIPFCISKCKYCDFFSVPCGKSEKNKKIIPDDYISSLCNEIAYRLKSYEIKFLESIYIGGGTPSLLTYDQLISIINTIKNNVEKFSYNECEITIESNPDDISEKLLNSWKEVGINRISLGVQSFDDQALSYVSRRTSSKINKNALEIINKKWKKQLSIDLICGLPHQSSNSFIRDINLLLKYYPDHISLYSLTIEDETPLGKEFNSGILQYDFDIADKLWLQCKDILKNHGYIHYEVSNFCLPGKQCVHNLKYWNHESYIGVGSGGTGTVYYDDGSGLRWTNIKKIEKYIDIWKKNDSIEPDVGAYSDLEKIDIKTSQFEFFMMGMRKLDGISTLQYKNIFNESIPLKYSDILDKWIKMGLCTKKSHSQNDELYTLGTEGIIYLNKFLEDLI